MVNGSCKHKMLNVFVFCRVIEKCGEMSRLQFKTPKLSRQCVGVCVCFQISVTDNTDPDCDSGP